MPSDLEPIAEDTNSPMEGDPRADAWDATLGIRSMQPGPNTFALKGREVHRHMLESNAFYREKYQMVQIMPPAAIHPALRGSIDTSISEPALHNEQPTRGSPMTSHTSSFVGTAASSSTLREISTRQARSERSDELKLVPDLQYIPRPTERAFIEEHHERRMHNSNDDARPRISVFESSSEEEKESNDYESLQLSPEKLEFQPPKTPKRSFLGKFFSKSRGPPSPVNIQYSNITATGPKSEKLPPKAASVLGETAAKHGITRSPSLTNRFFRRKDSLAEADSAPESPKKRHSMGSIASPPRSATSVGHGSAYRHRRGQSNDSPLKPLSQIPVRSQSLKHAMNESVPPTPPAKNTPPEVRAVKAVETVLNKQVSQQDTPTKRNHNSVAPDSGRWHTRIGNHAKPVAKQLVNKPRIVSRHASIITEEHIPEASSQFPTRHGGSTVISFDKAEETNEVGDCRRSSSAYSAEVDALLGAIMSADKAFGGENAKPTPEMSMVLQHTKKESSSSSGTIPVCFPELNSDPTIREFMAANRPAPARIQPVSRSATGVHAGFDEVASEIEATLANKTGRLSDKSITTRPGRNVVESSPPSFQHRSAVPSPLQPDYYLKPDVYVPPKKAPPRSRVAANKSRMTREEIQAFADKLCKAHDKEAGPAQTCSQKAYNAPSRLHFSPPPDIFNNVPNLAPPEISPEPKPGSLTSPSLKHSSVRSSATNPFLKQHTPASTGSPQSNTSPLPSSAGSSISSQDQILQMLKARDDDMKNMLEFMRKSNEDSEMHKKAVQEFQERLASLESSATPPPMSTASVGRGAELTPKSRKRCASRNRIPTNVAHEYYRRGQQDTPDARVQHVTDEDKPNKTKEDALIYRHVTEAPNHPLAQQTPRSSSNSHSLDAAGTQIQTVEELQHRLLCHEQTIAVLKKQLAEQIKVGSRAS